MDKNKSLMLAAAVFAVIALAQLLRSVFGWQAVIGSFDVPLYFSYIAIIVSGYLSWHMYKTSKK